VLPAFNPGRAVEQTWLSLCQFLAGRASEGDPWEALFVLDGCTDDTADRLARLSADTDLPIRVLSYPKNRGKGHAVRTGLLAARGAIRIFTDVDLAYPFEDVLRVAAAIKAGSAVAIGSRVHPQSWLQLPAGVLGYAYRRAVQGRLFGFLARLLLPISVIDTQAGLKGMTAQVAESLVPHLTCDGFGFDCELLTACARAGILPLELPVSVRYDDKTSTTGPGSALRMVHELWKIRKAWRGRTLALVPAPAMAPAEERVRPAAAA
jgi:glycosyltransferase involved in cell wall biosynthesis